MSLHAVHGAALSGRSVDAAAVMCTTEQQHGAAAIVRVGDDDDDDAGVAGLAAAAASFAAARGGLATSCGSAEAGTAVAGASDLDSLIGGDHEATFAIYGAVAVRRVLGRLAMRCNDGRMRNCMLTFRSFATTRPPQSDATLVRAVFGCRRCLEIATHDYELVHGEPASNIRHSHHYDGYRMQVSFFYGSDDSVRAAVTDTDASLWPSSIVCAPVIVDGKQAAQKMPLVVDVPSFWPQFSPKGEKFAFLSQSLCVIAVFQLLGRPHRHAQSSDSALSTAVSVDSIAERMGESTYATLRELIANGVSAATARSVGATMAFNRHTLFPFTTAQLREHFRSVVSARQPPSDAMLHMQQLIDVVKQLQSIGIFQSVHFMDGEDAKLCSGFVAITALSVYTANSNAYFQIDTSFLFFRLMLNVTLIHMVTAFDVSVPVVLAVHAGKTAEVYKRVLSIAIDLLPSLANATTVCSDRDAAIRLALRFTLPLATLLWCQWHVVALNIATTGQQYVLPTAVQAGGARSAGEHASPPVDEDDDRSDAVDGAAAAAATAASAHFSHSVAAAAAVSAVIRSRGAPANQSRRPLDRLVAAAWAAAKAPTPNGAREAIASMSRFTRVPRDALERAFDFGLAVVRAIGIHAAEEYLDSHRLTPHATVETRSASSADFERCSKCNALLSGRAMDNDPAAAAAAAVVAAARPDLVITAPIRCLFCCRDFHGSCAGLDGVSGDCVGVFVCTDCVAVGFVHSTELATSTTTAAVARPQVMRSGAVYVRDTSSFAAVQLIRVRTTLQSRMAHVVARSLTSASPHSRSTPTYGLEASLPVHPCGALASPQCLLSRSTRTCSQKAATVRGVLR